MLLNKIVMALATVALIATLFLMVLDQLIN